jgi:hypothetical protein
MKTLAVLLLLLALPAYAVTLSTPGAKLGEPNGLVTVIQGDLNVEGAHGAKIANVHVTGSLSVQHSDDVKLSNVIVDGPAWNVNNWTLSGSARDTFVDCTAVKLGKGWTGGQHPICYWNVDGTVEIRNRFEITVESAVTDCGPAWHFDDRNRYDQDNSLRIHLKNATCYAIWRWRADISRQVGCFNNRFVRDTVLVDGGAGKLLPSSSGTCDGSQAGCWGLWNSTFDACVFDASACIGRVDFYFQGGAHGLTFRNCTIKVPGRIELFDVHGVRFEDCSLGRDLLVQQEYGRPLPHAGDLILCRTSVTGTTTIGADYQAIPGFIVTTCAPVPAPPPAAIADLRRGTPLVYAGHVVYQPLLFTAPAGAKRYVATIGENGYFAKHFTPLLSQADSTSWAVTPAAGAVEKGYVQIRDDIHGRAVWVQSVGVSGDTSQLSNTVLTIAGPQFPTKPLAMAAAVIALAAGFFAIRGSRGFLRRSQGTQK